MTEFGTRQKSFVNPILSQEERRMIAWVDQTVAAASNADDIGESGEKPVLEFLNRYLPNCFRCFSGHFVSPTGKMSPQIDVMVLDSRYPLLSQNANGSVLAMFHSVIATIEVKTTLGKREIEDIWKKADSIEALHHEQQSGTGIPIYLYQMGFAYRTSLRLKTVFKHFFQRTCNYYPFVFLRILRLHAKDHVDEKPLGAGLWFERGTDPALLRSQSPLSDLYYDLTLQCLSSLGQRNFGFSEISYHIQHYLTWGTHPDDRPPLPENSR
jgi:hypothetical protein